MIGGRPTNLWLGLATSLAGATTVSLVALGFDPAIVATVVGSFTGVIGAAIALVAGQPPTLSPGDTYRVQSPGDQPDKSITVS